MVPTLEANAPEANPAVSSVVRPVGNCSPRQSHAVRARMITPMIAVSTWSSARVSTRMPIGMPSNAAAVTVMASRRWMSARQRAAFQATSGTPTELIATTATFGPNSRVSPGTTIECVPNPVIDWVAAANPVSRTTAMSSAVMRRTDRASYARPRSRNRAGHPPR